VPALFAPYRSGRAGAGVTVIFVQAIYDPSDLSAPMREPQCAIEDGDAALSDGDRGAPIFYQVRTAAGRARRDQASLQRDGEYGTAGPPEAARHPQPAPDRHSDGHLRRNPRGEMAYFIDLLRHDRRRLLRAAASEEDHRGALKRFNRDYGQVVMSADVIDIWNADAVSRPSPALGCEPQVEAGCVAIRSAHDPVPRHPQTLAVRAFCRP